MEGFTSKTIADKKEGYGIPIRELVQNSLDATEDGVQCRVEIVTARIEVAQIPLISSYKAILERAKQTQSQLESYGSQQKQVVENLELELEKRIVDVLIFVDNGLGMDGEGLDALIEHRSRDKKESSGGSYGVGHLAPYDLSSLRYVLYATKKNGNTLFTGVPVLAGFRDETGAQRGNIGRILKYRPTNESNPHFDYPKQTPVFLDPLMKARNQGTAVCILGLTDRWNRDYETVIASHFFSAILHERLSVSIKRDGLEGEAIRLDERRIEQVLNNLKNGRRARPSRGEILSGRDTWQSFRAVRDSQTQDLELSNGDRPIVYIISENVATSSVALIRSDMLVARHDTMLCSDFNDLRKSEDYMPFSLVIDIAKSRCGVELFQLVKKAEGPYHNRLTNGELSSRDERRLRELLVELAEKISSHLTNMEREGFDLSLFNSEVAAIRENKTATPVRRPTPKPPIPPGPPAPPKSARPLPRVFGRSMDANVEARTESVDDGWRIQMRIRSMQDTAVGDRVWLSFNVDEDSDSNAANSWLIPTRVLVNGVRQKTNGLLVPLGRLLGETPVVVDAILAGATEGGEGMTVAIRPVLSLRRKKKVVEEESKEEVMGT